jgi:hypothetical protein
MGPFVSYEEHEVLQIQSMILRLVHKLDEYLAAAFVFTTLFS